MAHIKMHENERAIDISLVRELLKSQFPKWAKLSIKPVTSAGTDNAIYRLGTDLCVRLPRTAQDASHIETQQKWLGQFAPLLPLTVPVFIALGNPQEIYPWHWAIYSWIDGENASHEHIVDLHQAAIDLAQFLRALQHIDPADGPLSRRGVPLATQDNETRNAIKSLHGVIDTDAATKAWQECLQAPEWDKAPVWIHGDLLPTNIVVKHGLINAVIDFDFLGIGDPACDLIVAWSILSREAREVFRTTLAVDDATWMRGRGWALSIALIILPYYQNSNPDLVAVAKRMINEILANS